jgi:arsenate reductase-like glutaredoxin family protein
MTCAKTQGFLAKHRIEPARQVDARREPIGRKAALELLRDVDEIYAAKGTRVVHVDLRRERPDDGALAALVLGPTGKLRAPALRKGRTLLVGFDEATYRRVLGGGGAP